MPETADESHRRLRSASILVVDDEKGPRESLRMILASEHRVLVATGGTEALAILQTTPVDLVTVDLNMPGMRGNELMRTIRELYPHIGVIIITGFGSVDTAVEGIRYGICDYIAKPFDIVQVTAAVTRALKRQYSRRRLIGFLEAIGKLLGTDRDTEEILAELGNSPALQRKLRLLLQEPGLDPSVGRASLADENAIEFLEVLAETIECREYFMRGHARRTAFYAALLGERAGLEGEDLSFLRLAAFLHDLGKVGVPLEMIQDRDDLSDDGRGAVAAHAAIGERLIKPLGFSSLVASAIRHHHERWDGNGYPDRLSGEAIPLAARIIAVADAFDAMTCERPYREALSEEEAITELGKQAGSQFDPRLAEMLVHVIESGVFELDSAESQPRDTGAAKRKP